ncbi:hypothetical protein [Ferrimonas sp. YFM]|uniref:hypothetical protein n=1 Tax=Ferrimonas sp. YFM TaxID=3028878 RepID=UPI002572E096|nr:hypothetical protein [Ferrimonas sp. YFM]BDY04883.1 hypothetical protein F0521_19240 [Ferrimonas sp. YFM]
MIQLNHKLVELLESSKSVSRTDSGRIEFSIAKGDREVVSDLLSRSGYSANLRTYREHGDTITVSINEAQWDWAVGKVFWSIQSFINDVRNIKCIPDCFYINDRRENLICTNSCDPNGEVLSISCALTLWDILSSVSEHNYPESGAAAGKDGMVFFIKNKEGDSKKFKLEPVFTASSIKEIDGQDEIKSALDKLKRKVLVGDAQDDERKKVLLSALQDILQETICDKNLFIKVLNKSKALLEKYEDHHDVFVKRFSVNKTLSEINSQNLDYVEKINGIVVSGQLRIYAVPTFAMVLAALRFKFGVENLLLVLFGLACIVFLAWEGLRVHDRHFEYIERRIEHDFKPYNTIAEKSSVREQAKLTIGELKGLVDSARKSISKARKVLIVVTVAIVSFLIYGTVLAKKAHPIAFNIESIMTTCRCVS